MSCAVNCRVSASLLKAFGKAGRAGNSGPIAKRCIAAKMLEGRALRVPLESTTVALRPLPIVSILPAERALQRRFLQALITGSEII